MLKKIRGLISKAGVMPSLFLLIALIFAGMVASLAQRLSAMNSRQTEQYLTEIAVTSASMVQQQLSGALENVRSIAAVLSQHKPFDPEEALASLQNNHLLQRFKRMGIVLPDGTLRATDGMILHLDPKDKRVMQALRGDVLIHGDLVDSRDNKPITVISAPIFDGDKPLGLVFATYPTEVFTKMLETPVFSGRGDSYIVNARGEGVSPEVGERYTNNNILTSLLRDAQIHRSSFTGIVEDMLRGRSNTVRVRSDEDESYFAYAPVGFNDWYIVMMLPTEVVSERTGATIALVLGTVGTWLVIFASLVGFMLYYQRQAQQQMARMAALVSNISGAVLRCKDDDKWTVMECSQGFEELIGYTAQELQEYFNNELRPLIHPDDQVKTFELQQELLRTSKHVTLEYRMLRKDGQAVWVVDRSQLVEEEDCRYWCSVLLDVSERIRAQDRRRIEEERYRILFEMSDSILYEFDLRTGVMHTTRRFFEKFDYPLPNEQNAHHPVDMNIIHPEDMAQFNSLHQALKNGASMAEALLRVRKHGGDWLWCHVHQTALHDASHKCIKALGKITNVDAETRALHKLRDDVQRDSFTGLYNKMATTELVTQALRHGSSDRGALCIIDADNFKQVNDRLGHCMGDGVLKGLATGLSQIFRSSDIVGRVGGDEFIVFLKDIKKLRALLLKMDQVLKLFRQTIEVDGKSVSISASVGIALSPKDGVDFDQLYRHADKALYRSKVQKDTYNFFDPDIDAL